MECTLKSGSCNIDDRAVNKRHTRSQNSCRQYPRPGLRRTWRAGGAGGHRYFIAWRFHESPEGQIQIREFPLARKIADTQPGPGALSCAQRQIETNILIATDSNAGDVELTEFAGGAG